jgi:hypothetical protein
MQLRRDRQRYSKCIDRESNPGRPRGRRAFYHWTIDAWIIGLRLNTNSTTTFNFSHQSTIAAGERGEGKSTFVAMSESMEIVRNYRTNLTDSFKTIVSFRIALHLLLKNGLILQVESLLRFHCKKHGFRGAMVARLTPDQEVACSNHVEITSVGVHWNTTSLLRNTVIY